MSNDVRDRIWKLEARVRDLESRLLGAARLMAEGNKGAIIDMQHQIDDLRNQSIGQMRVLLDLINILQEEEKKK